MISIRRLLNGRENLFVLNLCQMVKSTHVPF